MNRQAKIKIITAASLISLFIAGGAFFFWSRFLDQDKDKDNFQFSIPNWQPNSKLQNTPPANSKQIQNSKSEIQNSKTDKTYANQPYGFSFAYPKELNIAEFKEGEGDVILAQSGQNNQDTRNNNQNAGFQIFILPFDEAGPLTPERIKQDLPEMEIKEPQNVIIGKDDVKALIFFGQEPGFNRTREVWFIHNGFLYQVFAQAELDGFLGKIMDTWKFIEIQ